jgi:Ca-activated chloride channel family protein
VRTLEAVRQFAGQTLADWRSVPLSDLQFWRAGDVRLMFLGAIGLLLALLIVRWAAARAPGRHYVVLPALPGSMKRSRSALLAYAPLSCVLAGLVFFAIALADPFSSLVSREVSFPGRRIALVLDASSSMRRGFVAESLTQNRPTGPAFYTTVAAAKRFVELRMKSKYRDLMALVEFGDRAYVVTPFTNDYDNILLSISLIGDPTEFALFPDPGTVIGQAVQTSVALFQAFKFLNASGNLMVIFSDGEDTHTVINGFSLDTIVQSAIDAKIPVYLIRTNYGRDAGDMTPDALWIPAVQKTGGRFFAASDEASLLRAIAEIDKVSTGTIQVRRYTTQQPEFAVFAALAAACWTLAAALKLGVPYFQKLP